MIGISTIATEYGGWLVALAAVLALIVFSFRYFSYRLERRAHDLALAKKALRAHYRAVKSVVDDPAPSEELKASLCGFSEAVTDREFGHFLVKLAGDEAFSQIRIGAEARKIHEERASLSRKYEHLDKAFHTAVEAGVVALLLRWPETSDAYTSLAVQLASDERREAQITQKAFRFIKDRNRDDSSNHNDASGPNHPMPLPA